MGSTIKLPDIHDITLIFEYGGFVIVDIEIVGRGKDGHHGRESGRFCLAVHPIPGLLFSNGWQDLQKDLPSILGLMRTDNGQKIISF